MLETENNTTPIDLRKKQIKLWAIVFLTGTIVILGLWLLGTEEAVIESKEKIRDAAPVYDVTKAVDDKSYWIFKSEKKLAEQSETQASILKQIEEIRGTINQSPEQITQAEDKERELQTFKTRIEELEKRVLLKEELNAWSSQPTANQAFEQPVAPDNPQHFPPNQYYGSQHAGNGKLPVDATSGVNGGIFTESLALEVRDEYQNRQHVDSYIPAGSYAKAILLSGVDVSAGVSSQASPKPVLLRLVDQGSLPNKAVGQMKECRIIAAAYGDLSSERAYMRLEKLSCTQPDGYVIETDVDGYITGGDGKNGVRGRVVIRDGEVLKRGLMGGLLSGLGKATAQTFSTTTVSPLGMTNMLNGKDAFKAAGAEGVGDAFELLARYNIQRAEQYQPVIQISAGRVIEVVFHSGSKFGERRTRQREDKSEGPKVGNIFGGEQ